MNLKKKLKNHKIILLGKFDLVTLLQDGHKLFDGFPM